ncbi:MAG: polyprenyl synthetase family protein [Flavobacteriales bacterium]|nr:polyprenyl synthetase family protein [Flavobacteriales bacterium]
MKDIQELSVLIEKEIQQISYPKTPELLYDPIAYIMGLKGKRMRPILLLMAHQLFDKDLTKAISPALAIEIFHNFTLLHDDIMDNAPLRRGNPTVHEKWNNNVAILSGDTMVVQSYQMMADVDASIVKDVLNVFSKAATEVCEGQQWDMDFETQDDVSLSDHMKMIEYKTAVLLAASLQIGGITAGADKKEQEHLYGFGKNIGIAFQLKDDLLDAFGSPDTFGKQLGGDILANKKTFLYLKALQLADDIAKKQLQDYYTSEDSEGKISAVKEIFKSLDLEKHTIDMMKDYYTRALKHLEAIESNNKAPLIDFSDKLMERIS